MFSSLLLHNVEQPPLQLTTLASSVSTESVSTKEPSSIPTTYVPAQKSTTGTHVTTAQQSTTDTHVTTHESQRHTATLLHRKRTTAGSVVSFGTETEGDDRDACPILKGSKLIRTYRLASLTLLILFCLMSVVKILWFIKTDCFGIIKKLSVDFF